MTIAGVQMRLDYLTGMRKLREDSGSVRHERAPVRSRDRSRPALLSARRLEGQRLRRGCTRGESQRSIEATSKDGGYFFSRARRWAEGWTRFWPVFTLFCQFLMMGNFVGTCVFTNNPL